MKQVNKRTPIHATPEQCFISKQEKKEKYEGVGAFLKNMLSQRKEMEMNRN